MTHKQLEDFILALPATKLGYPFGEEAAVYKVGDHRSKKDGDRKMFALIAEGKEPVRISLKCDPTLAEHLREKYESVQPGYHLNKQHWNTIVLTGQLSDQEVLDLVNHSYDLVVKSLPATIRKNLRVREGS